MGLPARRLTGEKKQTRPHLRVVPRVSRSRSAGRASCRADASRELFVLACVVVVGVALFGLGRVMLAARATEASLRSNELREQIKAEQLVGDLLEIDMSALTVPSRIENIAGTSMRRSQAQSVEYMEMPAETAAQPVAPVGTAASVQSAEGTHEQAAVGPTGLLASLVEMAAGEAQVLLVGDVGLASSE